MVLIRRSWTCVVSDWMKRGCFPVVAQSAAQTGSYVLHASPSLHHIYTPDDAIVTVLMLRSMQPP